MKKRLTTIIVTGLAATMLVACQSSSKEDSTTQSADLNLDGFRVGNELSTLYEEYGETKPADYYIKATGWEYEYDKLTYDLVFSDEFDYEGLPDETKWTYDVGTGQWGWGNNELQRYTRDSNAWVEDDNLVIELRKEETESGGEIYTSARVKTKGLGDWMYGKFEIRAKLPSGRGTWPAIWMLPTKTIPYGGWPASGEIDIMEHVGYQQDWIHHNIHCQTFNGGNGTNKGRSNALEGVSEEFHTYACEWLPDKMNFYVDDELIWTYDPHEYVDGEVTSDIWPFDQEFHLIMNIAYGGNWGGARGIDDTCLPQRMYVDYVRVYQSPEINALVEERGY